MKTAVSSLTPVTNTSLLESATTAVNMHLLDSYGALVWLMLLQQIAMSTESMDWVCSLLYLMEFQ